MKGHMKHTRPPQKIKEVCDGFSNVQFIDQDSLYKVKRPSRDCGFDVIQFVTAFYI